MKAFASKLKRPKNESEMGPGVDTTKQYGGQGQSKVTL